MEGLEGPVQRTKPVNTTYTKEQKIVAAVWFNERLFTGMSFDQLKQNFLIRFKTDFPKYSTLRRWRKELFRNGNLPDKKNKVKSRTTLARLVYVPYVKESFVRYPDLTVRARANMLGMPVSTLDIILKNDLQDSDMSTTQKNNTKEADVDDSIIPEDEIKIENEGLDIQPNKSQ